MSRVWSILLSAHFAGSGEETWMMKYLPFAGSPLALKVTVAVTPWKFCRARTALHTSARAGTLPPASLAAFSMAFSRMAAQS